MRAPQGTAEASTRLEGRWLGAVRAAWILLFVLNLAAFGSLVVAHISAVEHPCADPACPLSPAQAEGLQRLGIGLASYVALSVGVAVLVVLTGSALALILFWRQSNDWMALLVGLFVVVYPISNFSLVAGPAITPGVGALLNGPDLILYYVVFLIFPNGRFVPRWTWLLLVAWVAFIWAFTALPIPELVLGYPILYLSVLAAQIYRYRRVSTPIQREQTKWVILGFVVVLLANILYYIALPYALPALVSGARIFQHGTLYDVFGYLVYELVTIALPVCFFIAIQRYRLFDIDVLINRALVYGPLSGMLAVVYFACVLGAQAIVQALTHQTTPRPVIIVASTLLIAALFQPLRHRIQAIIDRRFYRQKYDEAKTLAAFSATLRSEVELAELQAHLLDVIARTMHPEHISMWLSPEAPTQSTAGSEQQSGVEQSDGGVA